MSLFSCFVFSGGIRAWLQLEMGPSRASWSCTEAGSPGVVKSSPGGANVVAKQRSFWVQFLTPQLQILTHDLGQALIRYGIRTKFFPKSDLDFFLPSPRCGAGGQMRSPRHSLCSSVLAGAVLRHCWHFSPSSLPITPKSSISGE